MKNRNVSTLDKLGLKLRIYLALIVLLVSIDVRIYSSYSSDSKKRAVGHAFQVFKNISPDSNKLSVDLSDKKIEVKRK